MKAAKACLQCRESKRKCVRSNTGGPCGYCQRRQLSCSAQTISRLPARHSSEADSQIQDGSDATAESSESQCTPFSELTEEMTVEFVESYLRHLDGLPHSLFHRATLRTQLRRGEIGRGLLYAICALGAKFSPSAKHRALEPILTKEAKRLVQADLENVCIENVQACILLALLSSGDSQTSSEALFARIANSMAEVLRLNFSPDSGPTIMSETSHRIWWSLYILDRWCSSGLGLPRHMDTPICPGPRPLPIDEVSFNSLDYSCWAHSDTPKLGLFAHMVTLVDCFGPIQDLNRSIARGGMRATEKCEAVKQIGQQLEIWLQTLPPGIQMSIQNLHSHQQTHLGGPFIALHLVYHHLSALVYFNSLENKKPQYYGQGDHIAQCKSHASSFSSLLHLSRQMNGCQQNYPTVSYMTTVSSAVLLHTLLLGEPEDIPKARQELNTNFEALMELRRYWPATEAMISRLIAFQNICLISTESHKLDGWMVRFLLEHSLGLVKRTLPIVPQNFNLESDDITLKTRELSQEGRYTDFNFFRDN